MGNHRFTIPGLSQWENITRSWAQWERRGNQGFISMGNCKFRSIKSEVRVFGYMDIHISNKYSARPLSLSMGKKGQPGTHFNGKYIRKKLILYFNGKLQVKLGGRSFWLYRHPHFKYILCKTFVSLYGKEGTTRGSFQWKSQVYNTWLISVGKY